jgi:hypothetical protein
MAATNVQAFPGDVVIPGKQYAIELEADLAEADKSATTWYRLLKGGMRTGANGYSTQCELLVLAQGLHECVTFDFNHMVQLAGAGGCGLNVYRHDTFYSRVGIVKFRLTEYGSSVFYLDMKIDHDVVAVDRTWTVNLKVVQGGSYIEAPTTFLEKITSYTGIVTQREYDIGLSAFAVMPTSNAAPFTIMSTGNVGIGKTNPVYPLDVNGTFSYSGTTYNSGILGGSAHPVKDQLINSGTLSAGNWYRIAKNGTAVQGGTSGNRCMARFTITDVQSSEHSTRIFYAGSTFGSDPFFHLVANTSHDPPGVIEKVRIVDSEGADNEGCAIDIYIHATVGAHAVQVVMDDNIQLAGFALVNYEANPNITGMLVAEYDLGDITWGVSPADNGANSGIFMAQTGRVGIGTQTPAYTLDVNGDCQIGNTNPNLRLLPTSTGAGTINTYTNFVAPNLNEITVFNADCSVRTRDAHVNTAAYMRFLNVYAYSPVPAIRGGAVTFGTMNGLTGFGSNPTLERMRIDQNGNVGIGTNAPGYKLDVRGTGQFTDSLNVSKAATRASPARFSVTSGDTGIRLHMGTGGNGSYASTGIVTGGNNSGGGTVLFVFNKNQSGGTATSSQFWIIRKNYSGGWTQDGNTAYLIKALNGSGSGTTVSFRQNNNMLEYQYTSGGNGHFYALEFD